MTIRRFILEPSFVNYEYFNRKLTQRLLQRKNSFQKKKKKEERSDKLGLFNRFSQTLPQFLQRNIRSSLGARTSNWIHRKEFSRRIR